MVEFEGVAMRYGDGPEILSDVSLHLEPGSFHYLTGPSGAGKSTLLRLIYLNRRPTRGEIRLFGRPVSGLAREHVPAVRRRIGVVFQDFRLIDHLTAIENVALPLRIAGFRPGDYVADVAELLSWVGLGDRLHATPPVLSGGEKQRVAIARAVVAKPDVILADEPTGNVDPEIGARLMRLFMELNRLGTTVLVATHDPGLIERFPGRVMSLNQGHLTRHRGPVA